MEAPDYRSTIGLLTALYPGRVSITPREAAEAMHANIKSIYGAIRRATNPLPSKQIGDKVVIPLAAFARWLS
jgi:hypothetical protein